MDFTLEQLEHTAKALQTVVTSEKIKLRWGSTKRDAMIDLIKRGKPVSGYRVGWIKNTCNAVIDTLIQKSHEFNATFKHDRISTDDMRDVLGTCVRRFRKVTTSKETLLLD